MVKTGLVLLNHLSRIPFALSAAKKHVNKTLYIHLQPRTPSVQNVPIYSNIIAKIYASSVQNCDNLDVRVLISNLKGHKLNKPKIDILMYDSSFCQAEANSLAKDLAATIILKLDDIPSETEDQKSSDNGFEISTNDTENTKTKMYDNVVLGGTFDRLHVGHKILLTDAVLRARKRLVVGVTDVNMIKSKKLPELILPVEERIAEVKEFLYDIDTSLNFEVVPIQDPFGPTKSDPNLELIVVSAETLTGGRKVNEIRRQNNLNDLDIHCIELVEFETTEKDKETKISSSNRRMDILGSHILAPQPRPHLPARPYVIGLVGGIASGKSIMCERLKKFGAKIIDCDKLAHQLYEPGQELFESLKNHFGSHIIGEDGKIDRRVLGSIVFSDSNKLDELNGIVWPALLKEAKKQIKYLHETENCQIVILEAAVLIKAGWQNECHEVWSLIIPPEEATRRLKERNNLTEEEAKMRINSQLDNETIVKHSNVVFSSLWSYEYTQFQAEKAWKVLMENLNAKEQISKI